MIDSLSFLFQDDWACYNEVELNAPIDRVGGPGKDLIQADRIYKALTLFIGGGVNRALRRKIQSTSVRIIITLL